MLVCVVLVRPDPVLRMCARASAIRVMSYLAAGIGQGVGSQETLGGEGGRGISFPLLVEYSPRFYGCCWSKMDQEDMCVLVVIFAFLALFDRHVLPLFSLLPACGVAAFVVLG